MSDSMIAFLRSENIPTIEELRSELRQQGLELESWDEANSLEDVEGFWPAVYKDEEAGFEFLLMETDDEDLEDWEVDRSQLDGRDYTLELCFRTDPELTATALCVAHLCKRCDGLTFADDDELSINADNCDIWLENYL